MSAARALATPSHSRSGKNRRPTIDTTTAVLNASPQAALPLDQLRTIHDALADKKADDIRILDLTGVSESLDYFVIATANSAPQLQALERNVLEKLREAGVRPIGVEGPSSRWLLINLGAIVVHLMSPEARDFYDLEGLWADARPVDTTAPRAQA